MNKQNCTKGPVHIHSNDPEKVVGIGPNDWPEGIAVMSGGRRSKAERQANAELIAQAFNVLHETGMTPRELVKILKDAHEAMGKVATMCQVHNLHTGFLNDVNPYDAYRTLLPSMVKAGEVFEHQPVTPA